MRATDFFVDPNSYLLDDGPVLDEDLLDSMRQRPAEDDVAVATGLLDLAQEELEAFGTGGGQRLTNRQVALVIRTLEAVTERAGAALRLPFRDFTRFRSYWIRRGASGGGGWQARRDILEELFEPIRQRLQQLEDERRRPLLPDESLANLTDPSAVRQHLRRIQRTIIDDPAQAIGSAKELIESTAKIVLVERNQSIDENAAVPVLVKSAQQALGLHGSGQQAGPDGTAAVKKILGSVSGVAVGVAELRNAGYATGHGGAAAPTGLRARHAHLAVNASITWCQLMLDTLADHSAPWRTSTAPGEASEQGREDRGRRGQSDPR